MGVSEQDSRTGPAWAALLCTAALAGCGGSSSSGGGSIVSTPAEPTPIALTVTAPTADPVNATLTALPLKSETFNTLSVKIDSSRDAGVTGTYKSGVLQISYDAASGNYTFADPTGASGTPAARSVIAADRVDPVETKYSNSFCARGATGCSFEAYQVSHKGGSGFTYSYAALASWEQGTSNGTALTSTLHYAVIGATTPAAAIPRTGSANYALDLVGTEYLPQAQAQTNGTALKGTGTGSFDFAAGTLAFSGTMSAPATGSAATTAFSGSGRISATGNGFTSNFSFADQGLFTGSLAGWFFGPNAQELGAVFAARAGDGRIASGALLGRKN